jgi:hypothetical protein
MFTVLRMAEATYLMQIFASGFLAILFLQSDIDTIVDRRGNLGWQVDILRRVHLLESFPRY